jgi:hypothetical protein
MRGYGFLELATKRLVGKEQYAGFLDVSLQAPPLADHRLDRLGVLMYRTRVPPEFNDFSHGIEHEFHKVNTT